MNQDQWDIDVLTDMFEERDYMLIVTIPVQRNEPDSWYWKKDKMGHYTVKSAYTMIQDKKQEQHSSDNSGFWKRIWNLKIPPKVKKFAWRAASECLPTKDHLQMKKVNVNILCPTCNSGTETTKHSLVDCPFARACWQQIGISDEVNDGLVFKDWLIQILDRRNKEDSRMVLMLCWSLWKSRNEVVWKQRSMNTTEVVVLARSNLNHWITAQDKSFDTFLGYMTQEHGAEHWRAPKANTIKINTDAAIFSNSCCYSFAQVARDQTGALIEASSRCLVGKVSPEMAEIMGIRESLSWVKKQPSWNKVVVETDSLLAVQAIRSSAIELSYLGRLVKECKELMLQLKDRIVSLRFIKRSANNVAHYLARYSCSPADRMWRGDNAHSALIDVIAKDLVQ